MFAPVYRGAVRDLCLLRHLKSLCASCSEIKSLILRCFLFVFPQGGTDLIINSYGPIVKNNTKKKWLFFQDTKKMKVEQVIHPCENHLVSMTLK